MPIVKPSQLIRKIDAGNLHVSQLGWLESRFHFSFANYYNPLNLNFGVLRVLNDDLVKARSGFGAHPHHDAEIFTYVVDGELSHADSIGNKESLPRGCVQYLSAGTGIVHSEMNDGDNTCRFLQVWLTPDRRGHSPQYGSSRYERMDRHNTLLQVLGGTREAPAWELVRRVGAQIRLHQDANVFVAENDAGMTHMVELGEGRQAYLVCIEGSMDVNGVPLAARDAAELVPSAEQALPLVLAAGNSGSHFMLIEMAHAR